MAQTISFGNVEKQAAAHLRNVLSVPVYAVRTPEELPESWAYLQRTGGVSDSPVTDTARLTVSATAATAEAAFDLASTIRTALSRAVRAGSLGSIKTAHIVEVAAPYLDPDPDRPATFRYSATYAVTFLATIA